MRGLIILVDDEYQFLKVTKILFKKSGWQIHDFTSPIAALNFVIDAQQTGIEINGVILDYNMPEMNGNELGIKIREISDQIPIILCSGKPHGRCDFPFFQKPLIHSDWNRITDKYFAEKQKVI